MDWLKGMSGDWLRLMMVRAGSTFTMVSMDGSSSSGSRGVFQPSSACSLRRLSKRPSGLERAPRPLWNTGVFMAILVNCIYIQYTRRTGKQAIWVAQAHGAKVRAVLSARAPRAYASHVQILLPAALQRPPGRVRRCAQAATARAACGGTRTRRQPADRLAGE